MYNPSGADIQRAGTTITGKGRVKSAAAKEAIGGMLDAQVALMQSDTPETVVNPSKGGRNGKGGKGRGGKGKGEGEKDKEKDANAEAAKQLQRDIKLFLDAQLKQLVLLKSKVMKSYV